MIQSFALHVFLLLLGVLELTHAEPECQAPMSDDVSLIQGLLEPDLATKLQARSSHTAKKDSQLHVELALAGMRNGSDPDPAGGNGSASDGTTTQAPAVKGSDVKLNAAGDLQAFLSSIQFDVGLFVFFFICFLIMQKMYPMMYAWRWFDQDEKKFDLQRVQEEQGFFVWMWKAWNTPVLAMDRERREKTYNIRLPLSVEEGSGLDAAMLLKFNDLALELMVTIGLLACLLGIPVYAFASGGFAKDDKLSWAGIGNVVYNNTHITGIPLEDDDVKKLGGVQWIFWTVSVAVNIVVLFVMYRMKCYQNHYVEAKMGWLLRLPEPRCKTVLVQGIPKGENNDEKLKEHFENWFGKGCVESAFVIVNTQNLAVDQRTHATLKKEIATLEIELDALKNTPSTVDNYQEVLTYKKGEIKTRFRELVELQEAIKQEQEFVKSHHPNYTTNGFVTFKDRADADKALSIRLHMNDDTWILETPPDPADVRYFELEYSDELNTSHNLAGYAAIAALLFCFMPIVVAISNVSQAIAGFPSINNFLETTGMKSTVDGVMQSIGLTIMMSMLPTFLVMIFEAFFTFKGNRNGQLQIQTYYFWFLVLFVLLTTSVGSNLSKTLETLAESPFEVFSLLADMMPVTTHFYLNYVVMQPVTHGMNLTRYIQMIKYWSFKSWGMSWEEARRLSEPEDQDYYGIGSRSARFTMMLLIGLVFGTICPLMNVVVFYNFICCRFIYGYLIPYQECRKIDLGGVAWVMQMFHLQLGLLIYLIMMTGILCMRAATYGPCVVSAVSFLWWFIMFRWFWITRSDKLPHITANRAQQVGYDKYKPSSAEKKGAPYVQPELAWKAVGTPTPPKCLGHDAFARDADPMKKNSRIAGTTATRDMARNVPSATSQPFATSPSVVTTPYRSAPNIGAGNLYASNVPTYGFAPMGTATPQYGYRSSPNFGEAGRPPHMSMAGVDTNGDGRANYLVSGADRNFDGIPDALQAPSYRPM